MIDDQRKFIFVENPKTATFSVKHTLLGEENMFNLQDSRLATINHKTPELIELKYPEKWKSYLKFVVVRNTWDRAHSFFDFYQKIALSESYQTMSFDEWVADGCLPPDEGHLSNPMKGEGRYDDVLCQLRYVHGVDEVIVLHSFDHQERCRELQAGIDRISARLNIALQPIPLDGNNHGRSTRPIVWKQETVDRLAIKYKDEIKRFGFQPPITSVG